MTDTTHEVRHCIVGAGPGGLAALRAMLQVGLKVDVFEKHSAAGGIWDRTNEGTPMYESAHFISSRDESAYLGLPMPKSFPDYPRHDQILDDLRSFADAYGLNEHIQFNTSVQHADWDGGAWVVRTSDDSTRRYRTLTCANGTQWHASMPSLPGQDGFTGEIIHSQKYQTGSQSPASGCSWSVPETPAWILPVMRRASRPPLPSGAAWLLPDPQAHLWNAG